VWLRFFYCAVVACLAQTPADDSATFSTSVNLVTVPVVVRNARGEVVGTLRQQYFRLFGRGKLQTITKFSIERTEGTASLPAGPVGAGANGKTVAPVGRRLRSIFWPGCVASGSYVVRLVVRDSEGRTMSAQNGAVEIP
jgi:hypothetical protein